MIAKCRINGADIVIEQLASGAISIKGLDGGSIKANLRYIAESNGIPFDKNWNTRYFGTRVIKALNGIKVSNNLIAQERCMAGQFLTETDDGEVEITHDNVVKVEAMISYDSKYARSGNKESGPDDAWKENAVPTKKAEEAENATKNWSPFNVYKGYRGSTAFWMDKLKDFYFVKDSYSNIPKSRSEIFSFIIFNAVCAVDTENSTHINADKVGRVQLSERIIAHQNDLIELLKNDNRTYELISILSMDTEPEEGSGFPSRNNFSFATKFCHYACLYLFDEEFSEYQDSYSIYDDILGSALGMTPAQGKHTGEYYATFYKGYQDLIDQKIKESGQPVSRNGFDHLLWYFYKGHGKSKLK